MTKDMKQGVAKGEDAKQEVALELSKWMQTVTTGIKKASTIHGEDLVKKLHKKIEEEEKKSKEHAHKPEAKEKKESKQPENKPESKEKKDKPESPMRRPLSSYNVFTKEMFKRMSEESSDLSFAEKSKLISKMWNEMPENKKKVYNDQGEINKNTYRTRIKLITGHCQTPEQDTAVEPLVKTKSYRCNKNNEKLAFERALQKNAESIQALQKSIQRSAFLQQCTALGCFACICVSAYLFLSLRSCACI